MFILCGYFSLIGLCGELEAGVCEGAIFRVLLLMSLII